MSFRILPAAQADLNAIDDWVASKFGEPAAEQASEKLYKTFELLSRFPNLGIVRPDITSRDVRFFSVAPNAIIYTAGVAIVIHRVFPMRTEIRYIEL